MPQAETVWLVGTGGIGAEYARILQDCDVPFRAIGRGTISAERFHETTGVRPVTGGHAAFLSTVDTVARSAIVATPVPDLAAVGQDLLRAGVERLLLEKPAGLTAPEIAALAAFAAERKAEVYVAYNRRFFDSVRRARRMIAEDGGCTSFTFEFTERSHRIGPSPEAAEVKSEWVLANSSHILDMAFFLGGVPDPKRLHTEVSGGLPWHPRGAIFAGSGRTTAGALFAYHADWSAPGRWWVEVLTAKRRYIFRPLEELRVQEIGQPEPTVLPADDDLDTRFKPGYYRQTRAFLFGEEAEALLPIAEQARRAGTLYVRIAGYDDRA